ncbi:unnamed protein product [Blumeria hordei]|uniref:Uncharacterized protein n=2 Tax=Blumeria hordei TaxID=2867405 RepID=A0A383UR98_BLUHO|nr:CSEP0034 putative effector protein [Blumeria hordei DH14]SZF02841.1 unnamed protein product [Blumeria hordei]
MRFSSLAIVCQIASIFVTSKAWAILNHIDEQTKRFNCDGVYVRYNEFASRQRTRLVKSTDDRNSRAWSLVVQQLLNNKPMGEEDPSVMFRDDASAHLTYYKLDDLTKLDNYGSQSLRTDYVVAIDGSNRACAVILRRQDQAWDHSWMGEPTFQFCTIY